MGKTGNFLAVFFILLLIAGANVYLYINKSNTSISGFSISDLPANVKKLDASTILFLIQWFLILIVVLIFYAKFLKNRRKESKENKEIKIKTYSRGGTTTDLDSLYNLLKKRKTIKISEIAKSFGINSDIALDWCKILENSNLVNIDYPAFSEPEVKIK